MALRVEGWFILVLFITFAGGDKGVSAKCDFPAIFTFGDSNSDTGAWEAIFNGIKWPNGLTVGKEFKRACDGRLIIDFLAESIGLPYLNASMDRNGTSFKYGANFAVVGQTITPIIKPPLSLWPLDVQVTQFLDFKSQAMASKEPEATNIYPKPEAFSEGLFVIDIGQNDIAFSYTQNVSSLMGYFTDSVERLLKSGAKYLWVHNTCPIGCLPSSVYGCNSTLSNCTKDKYGCKVDSNDIAQLFNSHLQQTVHELRQKFPTAMITLVDIYKAKNYLITNDIEGFDNDLKLKFCCGTTPNSCGFSSKYACSNPSRYLNWDGTHFTEAANRVVANLIVDGSFSEPRLAFSEACHKPY